MVNSPLRVAILISGRGSNMQALIDACAEPDFPAEIVRVIANQPEAAGLDRAAESDIPVQVINHRDYAGREAFEQALTRQLQSDRVDLVCLAGFMRLLTPTFIRPWQDRLVNIHPSLLPAFKGLQTHERALAAGVRFTGCTVHYVRPEMDDGPIIGQAAVPVKNDDTPETLSARVLMAEHRLYPLALKMIAEGCVTVDGDTVTIRNADAPDMALLNPAD